MSIKLEKNVLILEEALRSHSGHWYEYDRAAKDALEQYSRANVQVLANISMEDSLAGELNATPHFRYTVWDQIYYHANPWIRYWGVLLHNYRVYSDVKRHLLHSDYVDVIFAPTTSMHHILGYAFIVKRFSESSFGQMVVLARTNISVYDETGNRKFRKTSVFWKLAIRLLRPSLKAGVIKLTTDSERLADEYEELSGVRFDVVPHPSLVVSADSRARVASQRTDPSSKVRLFMPGPARHEKGISRLLQAAALLDKLPGLPKLEIVLQWAKPIKMQDGSVLDPSYIQGLALDNVSVINITKTLTSEEYEKELLESDIIILPYSIQSYVARISGVAVEAMILGIPLLYTKGTWIETVASKFKCGTSMPEAVDGIVASICEATTRLNELQVVATRSREAVANFYSQQSFNAALLR